MLARHLASAQACVIGLAEELRYEGAVVARYAYAGVDLVSATDSDQQVLRSYEYIPDSGGRLWAVKGESGAVLAEFSYDSRWRAIGLVDSRASVAVQYGADGSAAVTEYFRGPEGDSSATSVRTMDDDRRVVSISDNCACGPASQFTYSDEGMTCSLDAEGRIRHWQYDALGRIVRSVRYPGAACPAAGQSPPSPLPVDSTDESYAYSTLARRLVAQGVWLDLDRIQTVTRPGAVRAGTSVVETADYSQARASIDPADYTCAPIPLPAGSVVCRSIVTGRYKTLNVERQERRATFNSYDARGRLVRTYGPVNLDFPSQTDVVPVEERAYWPDDDTSARRGRLRELKRYASPAAAPLVTSFDYDAFGAYRITAPSGGVTMILKDGRGRARFVVSADGGTRETRYADGLLPRLELLPSGAAVRTTYDGRGRVAATERFDRDPEAEGATPRLGWSMQFAYDAAGNRVHTERRDAVGRVTWQQGLAYDVHHNVVRDTNPESPTLARTWSYGAGGHLSGTTDEEGRGVAFTLDALGRATKVRRSGTDVQGLPVALDVAVYGYAANASSPIAVTDGNGQKADYLRDDFGQLYWLRSSTILWAAHDAWLANDARGNVLTRTESNVATSFTYDGLDRVTTMTVRNAPAGAVQVAYTYRYDEEGAIGRLTSIVEADRTTSFAYDVMGRLRSETIQEAAVAAPLVTSYTYDVDGALETVAYPTGLVVRYERDLATGEVAAVRSGDGTRTFASGVDHLPQGPATALTFGNGLALSATFDLRHEPLGVTSGPVSLTYLPSAAGDVAAITDGTSGVTRTFRYDFLDRLVESPAWLAYGYDGAGNRLTQSVEGVAARYTYDFDRVKERYEGAIRTHAFGYDKQSDLSAIVNYDASGAPIRAFCLRHDLLRRMYYFGRRSNTSLTAGGQACTQDSDITWGYSRFKYDARNRRVSRQEVATGVTQYTVFDASGNPLAELIQPTTPGGAWTTSREYVWLDGRPLAQLEHPGPGGGAAGYAYYVHADAIGLPRALTNEAGQAVWSASTRPYGDLVETTTPDPQNGRTVVTNLRLPGQYDERLLSYVGLQGPYYNWNRWYLPGVGRYLELDPIALAGGFNSTYGVDWYNYGNGNPLRFTDPDGTIAGVDDAAILVLVGGAAVVATWQTYVAQCTAAGNCPWDAATKCERTQCKLEYHGPHHNFPVLGRRCHIQLTCWKPGVKGSTSIIRIPAPCVGDYK